jgi:UDPglucose 6-dehydrogenase
MSEWLHREQNNMNVCVIGTGYVGLVAGCCFSDSGNQVICTDKDHNKIDKLNRGICTIYEPGLEELQRANMESGRLQFSTDVGSGVKSADVVFIAVGTPQDEDGSADLRHVESVASEIADNIESYTVVVCKSTVPVGTCNRVAEIIKSKTDVPFDVVSNPEFLKEGHAVEDFLRPARIVVGTGSEPAKELMTRLYAPFQRTKPCLFFVDVKSSEMIKYASNAMLATRISFMNEVSRLCDAVGADVEKVRMGMGSDPRIGNKFLFPGTGFGGSCFPKDLRALINTGRENGQKMEILDSVVAVNEVQKEVLVERFLNHFGKSASGLTVALWGLSFKPRTDDIREAPALTIIEHMLSRGMTVRASDPEAVPNTKELLGDKVTFSEDEYEIIEGADALFIVTEWSQYRQPDFAKIKGLMKQPIIFDGRNLFEPAEMESSGFTYYSVGRPPVGV